VVAAADGGDLRAVLRGASRGRAGQARAGAGRASVA